MNERQMSADVLTEMLREVAPERLVREHRGVTVEPEPAAHPSFLNNIWHLDLRRYLNGHAIAYRQAIFQESLDNVEYPNLLIGSIAEESYEKIVQKLEADRG